MVLKGKYLVSTKEILEGVQKVEAETLAAASCRKCKRKAALIEISSSDSEEELDESSEEESDEESDVSDCIMLE